MVEIFVPKFKYKIKREEEALEGKHGGSAEVFAKCERDMKKSDEIIAKVAKKKRWTFYMSNGK